jgi:hypothetical protein
MSDQDPTPEEVEELRLEAAQQEDEEQREKNIELAKKKGWQFQAGVGWVDEKGTVRLDDIGREL